jgi:hypothetical protein
MVFRIPRLFSKVCTRSLSLVINIFIDFKSVHFGMAPGRLSVALSAMCELKRVAMNNHLSVQQIIVMARFSLFINVFFISEILFPIDNLTL